MINLLKMDLHRFITNKMMYILLAVFAAFQVFGIFMINQYEEPNAQTNVLHSMMNESEFIQTMLAQTPSWVLMYIAVFSVYLYMSEYNAGFYKNYISMKNARIYSVISKIIILALFTCLMLVVMVFADLIGRELIFKQSTIGDVGFFVKLLVGQFLLHWAFTIVVLCVTMVVKRMIPSIVIGIVLVLNVIGMVLGALESFVGDTNLSSYLLVNSITRIKDFHDVGDIVHVLGVAIVFIGIGSLFAIRYKMREDLR